MFGTRSWWAAGLLAVLGLGVGAAAVAADPTPDDVLKNRGLTRSGRLYVLDAEADFLDKVGKLQPSYRQLQGLYDELSPIVQNQDEYEELDRQRALVNEQLRNIQAEIDAHPPLSNNLLKENRQNLLAQERQLRFQWNELNREVNLRSKNLVPDWKRKILSNDFQKRQGAFLKEAGALRAQADQIKERYRELSKDDVVKNALDALRISTKARLGLSPSPEFKKTSTWLIRAERATASENILARPRRKSTQIAPEAKGVARSKSKRSARPTPGAPATEPASFPPEPKGAVLPEPPDPGAPATEPASPPHLPTEVDRILQSLTLGNIAYNTPASMRCEERTKIQLLLSPRAAIEELKQKISGLGEKVGEQIRVADVMEADLYGKAFETQALRPERQAIGGTDDTEWQWEIVAREPGNQELHLVISAVLNVNGREGSKVLKVYDRTIDVHVTISHLTRTLIANNWQWLLGVVGTIGALVLTRAVGWWPSREARRFPNVLAPEALVGKIKILLFAANPRGTDPLDLHREFQEIDEEIRLGEFRDALELIIVPGTRLVDLLRKLNEAHPDIVHFSGHGNIDEEIILESGGREPVVPDKTRSPARDMRRWESLHEARRVSSPRALSKSALVDIVKACNQENIRVIVLNACHTRPQAEALSEVIDCVISMNRAISDVGATKFAASFYGALAFGRSVKKAFDQGLARLKAESIWETETPELMVRAGVDASTLVLVGPREDAGANQRTGARSDNVPGGRASTTGDRMNQTAESAPSRVRRLASRFRRRSTI
jgi:hypothetical protein